MISTLALVALGVPLLLAAILAVSSRNLVHAVLWLAVALGATAGLFVVLGAPFLATVQVLLYIGGIVTLLIFGVMLTGRVGGGAVLRETRRHVRAAFVAVTLFAAIAVAVLRTPGLDAAPAAGPVTTGALADVLLGKDLLAFEVLSVLLLAAMIGAIVIARPRDFGARQGGPVAGPRPGGATGDPP